jgi:hypothetical protein
MKLNIIFAIILSAIIGCNTSNQQKKDSSKKLERDLINILNDTIKVEGKIAQVDNETKFLMFCSALNNNSTEPNYIVITVKNINTGEKKEICTEAPFLQGAFFRQCGKYIKPIDYKYYRDRYFEFSNDSALWNISFDLYSSSEFEKYKFNINADEYVENAKKKDLTIMFDPYKESRKEQIMFAHIMFNNGIMMTRGCVAGNYCNLSYFSSK